MADYTPPFAENGELRAPDATEQSLGIPCGPFDLAMHNYLHNLSQGQVKNIADEAGVASLSEGDKTVLFRAVEALIDAATGGNPAGYILMTQARARLPIFPEVLNTDGRIVVTAPSTGTVRVPGGVDFLHRGIFQVTTAQTDLSTDASKIYHLRWNPTDGFALKDLSSAIYNPSTLDDENAAFDSAHDDMLVARVVTNSSNVAAITNLANKDRLAKSQILTGTDVRLSGQNAANFLFAADINWARTPTLKDLSFVLQTKPSNTDDDTAISRPGSVDRTDLNAVATQVVNNLEIPVTRYNLDALVMRDFADNLSANFSISA